MVFAVGRALGRKRRAAPTFLNERSHSAGGPKAENSKSFQEPSRSLITEPYRDRFVGSGARRASDLPSRILTWARPSRPAASEPSALPVGATSTPGKNIQDQPQDVPQSGAQCVRLSQTGSATRRPAAISGGCGPYSRRNLPLRTQGARNTHQFRGTSQPSGAIEWLSTSAPMARYARASAAGVVSRGP